MASLEVKSVSVFWDEGRRPYQNWGGGNHFTASWAGRELPITSSGYITAALRWKCEQFTQASWCVMREEKRADGRMVENLVENHPMRPLLKFPCGTGRGAMSRTEFLTRMLISYEVNGIAYARKLRHAGGYTNRLQYLPHWMVYPERKPGSLNDIDYYRVTWAGGSIDLDPSQIVVWQQGCDPARPWLGISPLKSVLAERLTERQISAYNNFIFSNLSVGNRLITPKSWDDAADFNEDRAKDVQKELGKMRGSGVGGDVVLPIPLDAQELHTTPEDMTVIEVNKIPLVKLMAAANVDPTVIPAFAAFFPDSKGADAKAKNDTAFKNSILPLGQSYGERQTLDVLPDFGDIMAERVAMDTSKVWQLLEDQTQVWTRADKSFLAGRLTLNESREATGHEEDQTEFGQKYYTQMPQLINGQHRDNELNGTNGKLANENDRATQPAGGKTAKFWRMSQVLGGEER